MRPLLRQDDGTMEIDKEFLASSSGVAVMAVLSVLDCVCLALGLYNIFLIYRKWKNRNALAALNMTSDSPKTREMGA